MKNYYTILGVQRTASSADIKRAYRRLAINFHPDKNPDPEAEQRFKEINEAYDVIGDPDKKKTYDSRLDNPFAGILEAEIQLRHRDPAYHRKKPAGSRPHAKPTTNELIRAYIGYFKWATYTGFALTFLLALDYMLPYRSVTDQIDEIYTVSKSSARHSPSVVYAYDEIVTKKGKSIRVYDHAADHFADQPDIKIERTILFSKPMAVLCLKDNYRAELGYLYRTAIGFVPMSLMIVTSLGIALKNRVEFLFNVSIVSIILIIITLYLIFAL